MPKKSPPSKKTEYNLRNQATQTDNDRTYRELIQKHFEDSSGTILDKLNNFPRFVSRQTLSIFMAKNEIFTKILNVHGNIIECGVFMGGGLFTWAQLSSIYEPYNHNRKVIGFDTFTGFPQLHHKDKNEILEHKKEGSYKFDSIKELNEGVNLYNLNRPIGHLEKIEFVKGDATQTIPGYLKENPHTVVSLLYLDFDLYEPTLVALKSFLPRMPKGSVIAFDELNQKQWPGETMAVMESIGLNHLEIKRLNFTPAISYAILH